MTSTDRELIALHALCARMVPAAYDENPRVDLVSAVQSRIASLPAHMQSELRTAIRIFDHPLTALTTAARPARFSALEPATQDAILRAWECSHIPLRRTILQAIRRLLVSTYYSIPEVQAAIGYAGPLRGRVPVVPWEGPLEGSASTVIAGAPSAVNPEAPEAVSRGDVHRSEDAIIHADGAVYRCQVCIVGSGAGGAVAAARLADAGLSVIVLEEGGSYSTADFNDSERDMMPRLYADAGARATDDASLSLLQGRCVGGGSTVNWMLMLRPQPWVMDEWSRTHGIAMLGESTLIPAIERIERETRAGFLPAGAHSPSNRIILDGAAALGWSAESARINAQGCVRAGTCGLGCSHGAKQGAGAVYMPLAASKGARIFADVRADRIAHHEMHKSVQCAVLDRASGRETARITIRADIVVCAAGAVGTPVLLQKSGMGGGGVGRYLRLHPTTGVRGLYDRVMYGGAGVPQSSLVTQFMHNGDGYGFWIECPPLLPSLASVAVGGFGSEHREAMRAFPHLAALIVLTRDGAARDHSSGSVSVSRAGRVRLRYVPHPLDRQRIAAGISAAARLHLAAGAREAATLHSPALRIRSERDIAQIRHASLAPNRIALFSAHVNGTCRMGTDPRTSGCTPRGERHGEPGIFVVDGSLFPTAPGVNPQAAIMAMASLVSEAILDRLH